MNQKYFESFSPVAPADLRGVELFWQDLDVEQAKKLQPAKSLFNRIAAGSPYLKTLILHNSAFAAKVLDDTPEKLIFDICTDCRALSRSENYDSIERGLRQNKSKAALLIAMADVAGIWDVVQVTAALTQFADACLNASINFLLRQAAANKKITLKDIDDPSRGCGYVVLAMGKHGAGELNYSSDIDLIVFMILRLHH